jgi:hypothetical protein
MSRHWSDVVFVRLRRLMGLRTELMVLTVAEVVALSYYGGLAQSGPDRWCGQSQRGSSPTSTPTCGSRCTGCAPVSRGPGFRRSRFIRDVLRDFAGTLRAVLVK